MEILSVEKLNFKYPSANENALSNLDFKIEKGDFVLLCGKTGSGKTTLLKMLKKEIAPFGEKSGTIIFGGKNANEAKPSDIGFVFQNPENQIVCDKVWHELAFGLENMGISSGEIRLRVAEAASYFGISGWFEKNTDELSGGQKQLLNLASAMVMSPEILLLDEPTSQLDPIASIEFINTLKRINNDFGTTVIITEHRTEDIIPVADKMMIIDRGIITAFDGVDDVCLKKCNDDIIGNFPASVRIWKNTGAKDNCPLTVSEAKKYITNNFDNSIRTLSHESYLPSKETAVLCRGICFRYNKNSDDVVRGLSLEIKKGEIHCILGANAAGKTTLLKLIAGLIKPYHGSIEIFGKKTTSYKAGELYRQNISMLPQCVQNVFSGDTLEEDFNQYCNALGYNSKEKEEKINGIVNTFKISQYLKKNPLDLSGGEQQKCAVAKLLIAEPKIILMDEPVKSLDNIEKNTVAKIIKELSASGITIIIVTHDTEFAADVAERCSLLFNGEIVSVDEPFRFFAGNCFYTTAASRISRGFFDNAVTVNDVTELCLQNRGECNGE